MRVLHVIDSLSIGGTQRLALDLIRELTRRGAGQHELCVLLTPSSTYSGYELPVLPRYLSFSGRYRHPLEMGRCIVRLRKLIRDIEPDIVHSYLWLSGVVVSASVLGTSIRHVHHIVDRRDSYRSRRLPARAKKWLTGLLFRWSKARFLAVSQACKDFFVEHTGWAGDDITVAFNSIDPAPFAKAVERRPHDGPPVIGAAGRLVEEKGLEYLIQAVRLLKSRQSGPFQVLIAGEGPLASAIERQVRDAGLEGSVQLLGRVESMPEFYSRCDIFVVPSVYAEGLPSTILEAMASGCVVVAADVGGAREVISDGENGLLVSSREAETLSAALSRIVSDRPLRERLAVAGRERVRGGFTVERMTDTVLTVYAGICGGLDGTTMHNSAEHV